MRKILLTALLASGATALHAEYPSVMFRTADGQETTIASRGLEITFEAGNLVARTPESTVTLAVSDLRSMMFSNVASGIVDVTADDAADALPVTVFRIDGTMAGTFTSVAEAQLSLSSGLYICKKSNGETSKIAVK